MELRRQLDIVPPLVEDRSNVVPMRPRNIEAEQNVLAAVMMKPGTLARVRDRLLIEDFSDGQHRIILRAAIELQSESVPIELQTVWNRLKQAGDHEAVGLSYLSELCASYWTDTTLDYWVDEVVDCAQKWMLIKASNKALIEAAEPASNASDLLTRYSAQLQVISSRKATPAATSLPAIADAVIDQMWLLQQRASLPGVSTGFDKLDDLTGGFVPGEFTIVAARPSMGKSALMCTLILNCLNAGVPVAVFSAETPKQKIVQRLLGQKLRMPQKKLRFADLQEEDFERLTEAVNEFKVWPACEIFDAQDGINTPGKIKAKMMRLQSKGIVPGVFFVDHLHELKSDSDFNDDKQRFEQVAVDIRDNIVREMKLPGVLFAQLSRNVEGRRDKRPVMSDLRESGALEQAADNVWTLYREEYYDPETTKRGDGEILVRKCRDGETGTVHCSFNSVTGIWAESTVMGTGSRKYGSGKGLQPVVEND